MAGAWACGVPLAPVVLAVEADDQRLIARASFVYDALYAWCRQHTD